MKQGLTFTTAECLVLWEALQQFVDNSDDDLDERTVEKVSLAQALVDRFDAAFGE